MAVIAGVNAPEVALLSWHQSQKVSLPQTDVQGQALRFSSILFSCLILICWDGWIPADERNLMFLVLGLQRNCRSSWWNRLSWGRNWRGNFSIWKVRQWSIYSFICKDLSIKCQSLKGRGVQFSLVNYVEIAETVSRLESCRSSKHPTCGESMDLKLKKSLI